MHGILVVLIASGIFVLASFVALYSYGQFARRVRGKPSSALRVEEAATALDRLIDPLVRPRPGQSGLALIPENLTAFALRALSARGAGRSLDLMYYYWKSDVTGGLLSREVLAAADRGVRVRVLIDDISSRGDDGAYLAYDSHPNIELRLFNPARDRTGALRRGLDMLLRATTATRRMHNKAWIADGRLAIVGGRNVGDAYFDASEQANFHDMDMLLLGQAVQDAEIIFDRFWNSAAALPVRKLNFRKPNLPKVRARLEAMAAGGGAVPYIRKLMAQHDVKRMLEGDLPLRWTTTARVVADPPEKVMGGKEAEWLGHVILDTIRKASRNVEIISPYFIPGTSGAADLLELTRKGVDIAVSTNSLAATDVMAVHGAYANYRKPLLEAGVRIFELRPDITERQGKSLFGSSGASLHTKAFTVDGRTGFVGSFNFDPRSHSLNTEMGIMFEDAALVAEVSAVFARQISPQESYRVRVAEGQLAWEDGEGSKMHIWRSEPLATVWRKMAAAVIGWLPIESQL